ncbi:thioredoxin family protein [Blastopirellula sp. JC732]|uniref:Thioredoxin family protein n=1 Tax=Blastopirellula sediminis TaxID=2894196 RepID=A0A9X1SG79_9BACT|nr:thioredoxin family protein [Blastopirellula sediminis]MCC9608531.1 thioredoxin family protein [Blastopirellula sediminis]MCC9628692.1 thioredoxin family protein [Blastopirellula sediminis]
MKRKISQAARATVRNLACLTLILGSPALAIASEAARANAAVCLAYAAVVKEVPELVTPVGPAPPEVVPAEPTNYRDAYELYKSRQRPLVVMVTASWCPYCPAMKNELLGMKREGKLPDASVVIVDYDQDRATARTVMGSQRTLPALAVYHYVGGKPKQSRPAKAAEVPRVLAES